MSAPRAPFGPDSVLQVAPGVLVAEFDEPSFDVAVVDDHTAHVLAGSAAIVWASVDGRRTTEEVVAEVADLYGTEPGTIRADVLAGLAEMSAHGLLVDASARPASGTGDAVAGPPGHDLEGAGPAAGPASGDAVLPGDRLDVLPKPPDP